MDKKIVFTGGGTAGHVTPNIALIEALQQDNWQIDYIGSIDGVEKAMIAAINIPYHAIRCGKLRRYFSLKNFSDPFNILTGILQSFFLLRKIKPDIVFSKGGFVALPVVIAAKLIGIPIIAHESDMSPGLANRLSFPFVDNICVTFEAAKNHFKHQDKIAVTGTPIRQELFNGNRARGLELCGFTAEKSCLMVIGGSLGSNAMNRTIRQGLDALCERFQVIHVCGKGNVDSEFANKSGYSQFEYVNAELPDLFAASDMIISRAGANSLCEILALEKPHVLVPLSLKASRGDQIQNARYFEKQGISVVIQEESLTPTTLLAAIDTLVTNHDEVVNKIRALHIKSATLTIVDMIKARTQGILA